MEIRKANDEDLKQLMIVYKQFFPVHVIFTRSDDDVLSYLRNFKGEILVAFDNNRVVGGIAIEKKQFGHVLAELKHIAAIGKKKFVKNTVTELIKKAEQSSNAAKVEFHIADGETLKYSFFKKLGYKVEAKLASHYRPNEMCCILGKVISNG